MTKNSGEYDNFTHLVDGVLRVSHSEIKNKLESEKKAKKRKKSKKSSASRERA